MHARRRVGRAREGVVDAVALRPEGRGRFRYVSGAAVQGVGAAGPAAHEIEGDDRAVDHRASLRQRKEAARARLPRLLVSYIDASSTARAEVVAKAVVALRITHSFTVKKHTTLQNHAYGRFARHAVDKSSHEPFKC